MVPAQGASPSRRTDAEIVAHLREGGPALVALSGGVDSAVVAALAYEALGRSAVAVTLTGPSVSEREVGRARALAEAVGIGHVVLEADPLARTEYRENRPDRCYFCRTVETERLRAFGDPRAVRQYLDGVHLDDLTEDRPGLRAMNEAGFLHPLLWAGWTKADVRAAARARGLPNAEQPSDACLASRIAHGDPISAELLGRVEAAEAVLLALGFRRVRVRVRGNDARIEVDPDEVARLLADPTAPQVERQVRSLGFDSVTLDPYGYRGTPRGAPAAP
jgi:pyridinium-3,5-biscarboxylic acid mononucleotide sulfurtransferase